MADYGSEVKGIHGDGTFIICIILILCLCMGVF